MADKALDSELLAKAIRRMFEDVREHLDDDSDVYNQLVDALFHRAGSRFREASEIVVAYFIQRCEVFDETAE